MANNNNTDAGLAVAFDFSAANPGDQVADATMAEVVRRLIGLVQLATSNGGTVVSRTAPVDTSLVWFLADENGIPTGAGFTYNVAEGQWESTDQTLPACYEACLSDDETNLLQKDNDGNLFLLQAAIENLISTKQQSISTDSQNILRVGSDGGIYGDKTLIGVSSDTGNALTTGGDSLAFFDEARLGISADADNKLELGTDDLPKFVPAVSADANNDLSIGADGLFYYSEPAAGVGGGVSTDADNDLVGGTDGKPFLSFDDSLSTDADNEIAIGTDDLLYVPAKHHASLQVEDNVTTTTFSGTSTNFSQKVQVTTFNDNGDARGAVPDHTNDHITIAKAGTYLVQASVVLTGAAGEVYSLAVFVNNGATQKGVRMTKEMNLVGHNDGSASLGFPVDLAQGDTVELWAQNETGTAAMTMQDGSLSVVQID